MSGAPTPSGWYHDPAAADGGLRWWDGQQWTTHIRQPPPESPPVPPEPTVPPPPARPRPQRIEPAPPRPTVPIPLPVREPDHPAPTGARPWWGRKRLLVPAGALVLASVLFTIDGGSESTEIAADGTETAEIEPDRFAGQPADDPVTTTNQRASTTRDTEPTIAPSSSVASTTLTTTAPTATSPRPTEASTSSVTVGAERSTTTPTTETPAPETPTTGATTAPTTVATVATTPPTTPATTGGCHPSYTGACVPIASDVDCLGGGGNGPAYVRGPVQVVGSDDYGLDRDGDGIGCEQD